MVRVKVEPQRSLAPNFLKNPVVDSSSAHRNSLLYPRNGPVAHYQENPQEPRRSSSQFDTAQSANPEDIAGDSFRLTAVQKYMLRCIKHNGGSAPVSLIQQYVAKRWGKMRKRDGSRYTYDYRRVISASLANTSNINPLFERDQRANDWWLLGARAKTPEVMSALNNYDGEDLEEDDSENGESPPRSISQSDLFSQCETIPVEGDSTVSQDLLGMKRKVNERLQANKRIRLGYQADADSERSPPEILASGQTVEQLQVIIAMVIDENGGCCALKTIFDYVQRFTRTFHWSVNQDRGFHRKKSIQPHSDADLYQAITDSLLDVSHYLSFKPHPTKTDFWVTCTETQETRSASHGGVHSDALIPPSDYDNSTDSGANPITSGKNVLSSSRGVADTPGKNNDTGVNENADKLLGSDNNSQSESESSSATSQRFDASPEPITEEKNDSSESKEEYTMELNEQKSGTTSTDSRAVIANTSSRVPNMQAILMKILISNGGTCSFEKIYQVMSQEWPSLIKGVDVKRALLASLSHNPPGNFKQDPTNKAIWSISSRAMKRNF